MNGRRKGADPGGENSPAPRRVFLTFKPARILYDPKKREVTERAFSLVAQERNIAARRPRK